MREQYTSYSDCVDFFKSAQKTNPNLFKVETIGTTWEDREIIAVSITNNIKTNKDKPALFYTGTIHAREWIGIELSLAFAQYILEHIDYDPQLNAMFDRSTLYMVPCANPDGFEYSRNHFAFWRKNRRRNPDGSFGVDLNRNFSVGFTPNKDTTSNVYSGPSAFSEPETAALRDFVVEHKNITIALDYHSQGNVFFPAHNFIHEDAEDAIDLNLLAGNMAEEIRHESGREYGIHMGKPPVHLISGSGREFYYSQGALAIVA
ncbi:MAG: M14 family zinc carboxypeptidase, partial [Campylobacterota bacterium]|nr:M14 family zinc carboxypeptidase [Campylobacterota bacterium]